MRFSDPLYNIFEQHLYNALVENETTDDFLDRVVNAYMTALTADAMIPQEHRPTVEVDLREEVLEMLRKKTYGHYNLTEFRRSQAAAAAVKTPTKRSRRARKAARPSSFVPSRGLISSCLRVRLLPLLPQDH